MSRHILLGVTGSVAAVKAPELVIELIEKLKVHVKVLLTQGGKNFWTKAAQYDPDSWKKLNHLLQTLPSEQLQVIGE